MHNKKQLVLTKNGKSSYRIVINREASGSVLLAARELKKFILQASGASIPIVSDKSKPKDKEIILGMNNHMSALKKEIDLKKLGKDGFAILTIEQNLVIAGSDTRGALYGVYSFLEEYVGFRWLTSKVTHVPKTKTIVLSSINDIQIPTLEYREVYYSDAMDPAFAARMKLNGNTSVIKNGKMALERHAGWGTWCHTAFTLVRPEKYFRKHPEYFALTEGKRQRKQLCFSNPNVLKIACNTIDRLIKNPVDMIPFSSRVKSRSVMPSWADKKDVIWDVSQMDGGGPCDCKKCAAIDKREKSRIGSILRFVNKIAQKHPDKIISTLSYCYSRKPPRKTKPRKNVSIMLCNIECTRSKPIHRSPFKEDMSFVTDMRTWARLSRRLFVWDYVVNFAHLFSPNPNLRVQKDNVNFFVRNKAKGIFSQANREVGGEFCELRAYLISKLLWNPKINVNTVINDFLKHYYGPAARNIRRYIDLLHDTAERSKEKLGIYEAPEKHRKGFLSPANIRRYEKIFDNAEKTVRRNKTLLLRVRTARMPVMYARLMTRTGSINSRRKLLDCFVALCKVNGIIQLSEVGMSLKDFTKKQLEILK